MEQCSKTYTRPAGKITLYWTEKGLTRIQLPGSRNTPSGGSPSRHSNRQERIAPPPPAYLERVADLLQQSLEGKPADFTGIPLDLTRIAPFHKKIYTWLRKVKPGSCVTYGELARRAGSPGAARAVGQAMAANPLPLLIPCHRVIRSDGSPGEYSALSGTRSKVRLLEREGVTLRKGEPSLRTS